MKQYDVDIEFKILHTILDSLREYDHYTPFNKRCIAYISDKITNLMEPEPEDNTVDGAIPVNEEIHFAPHDDDYELYSATMDDVILPPKRSNVIETPRSDYML
jgi:hypothetical protein